MDITAITTVTVADLAAAQGGVGSEHYTDLVTVECPDTYDPAAITAADIIHDPAITMVAERPRPVVVSDDPDNPEWAHGLDGDVATPEQFAASLRSIGGVIRIDAEGTVVEGGADTALIWIDY